MPVIINYSIDCFIHKFGCLFPEIPEYLLFFGRCSLEFDVDENNQIQINYDGCDRYFQKMLDFLNIAKEKIELDEILKIDGEVNIILPCDSFYLEYSHQNFGKYHLEHNILIKRKDNDEFTIYDDNPLYMGKMGKEIICNSYNQRTIYKYTIIQDIEQQKCLPFFSHNAMAYQVDIYGFLYKFLNGKTPSLNILLSLEELRITFKRYRALVLLCKSLNEINRGIANECLDAAIKLEDELSIITNLASIGLKDSERYIIRIRKRISNLKLHQDAFNAQYKKMIERLETCVEI